MKHIKLFEELNKETYKKAAEKLRELGQITRSENLLDYANRNDIFTFNLFFFDEYNEKTKEMINKKTITVRSHFHKVQPYLDGDFIEDTSVEELVDKFTKKNTNGTNFVISYGFEFYFKILKEDVEKYKLDGNIFNPFCINVLLYNEISECEDANHKFKITLEGPNDMTEVLEYTNFDMGFVTRNSGTKLKKLIKYFLLDENTIVRDLVAFLDAEPKQYANFQKDIDNININKLCRDTSTSDTTIHLN